MNEPTQLQIALAAADAGNAGHWPTVAAILADEYRKVAKVMDNLDDIFHAMRPRYCGHPTMDGRYPCWIVWLPKEGTTERKTLIGAVLEFSEQSTLETP